MNIDTVSSERDDEFSQINVAGQIKSGMPNSILTGLFSP